MGSDVKQADNRAEWLRFAAPFRRIYVERRALQYEVAQSVLSRFPDLPVVPIEDYRDLFHRPGQSFSVQKSSPALILAVKQGELLYRGNDRINSWHRTTLYYNDMIRNCLYNCEYCFLQGMHQSAHTLIFVNFEDFLSAVRNEVDEKRRNSARADGESPLLHLSLSYLTDLLGFAPVVPFASKWVEAAPSLPEVEFEIRTKSDNYPSLRKLRPASNVILAWSISPADIASRLERGTASLPNRLFAAASAARAGFRVRLCFDPVIVGHDWQRRYERCLHEAFSRLPAELVEMASYGTLRMNATQLRRIERDRPSALSLHGIRRRDGGLSTYDDRVIEEVRKTMGALLSRYLPPERILFVHG